MFHASKISETFCLLYKDIYLFLCFFLEMLLVLLQIRRIYYMLHVASYHYYLLAKIHLYQSYFNMSCH